MTTQFPKIKTVRYRLNTWEQIKIAAEMFSLTTSEYIRKVMEKKVERIDLKQVLPEQEVHSDDSD